MEPRALINMLACVGVASAYGCGDSGTPTPTEPAAPVFTTLQIAPTAASIFTLPPGNTVQLTATARDQNGKAMPGNGSLAFASSNTVSAVVSSGGRVTAAAIGTAQITATLTIGSVTQTAVASISVQEASARADVTAPALTFLPSETDVSAGGIVTWTFGAINHTVTFSTTGAPADVPVLRDGAASRTFPTPGVYSYRCELHAGMTGTVRVH